MEGVLSGVTPLMLTRYFQVDWLKFIFLRNTDTAIRLVIKSQFGDMDLPQATPSLFNTMTQVPNTCHLVTATEIIQMKW